MKINKIELKNYRIHKEYDVCFENGINLLLGNNGSGKSSVLEAIGLALFDSNVRGITKDIVSNGERNGSIKILFTGSDEKEYEVERKFGNISSVNLTCLDSSQKTWNSKDDVYRQIGKIIEADITNDEYFESVICAKQNKFIDIFLKKPAERGNHFDKLFNIEIYNKLWLLINEQNEKKYSKEKSDKELIKKALAERQKNIKDLENEQEFFNKKIKMLTDEMIITEKDFVDKKSELDKSIRQKSEINAKENDYKNLENTMLLLISTRDDNKRSFIYSEQAKSYLIENKGDYNKYESAKNNCNILEKEYLQFKNAAKEHDIYLAYQQELKIEQNDLENSKKTEENKIVDLDDRIVKVKSEQELKQNELKKINDGKEKNEKGYIEIKRSINALKPVFDELEKLAEKKDDNNKEIERLKGELISLEQQIIPEEILVNERKIIKDEKEKLTNLEKQRHDIKSRIDVLKKAKIDLSTGICPTLKVPCENMAGNSADYFETRFKELALEKESIDRNMEEYCSMADKEEEYNKKKIISANNSERKIKTEDMLKESRINKDEYEISEKTLLENAKKINPTLDSIKEIKNLIDKMGKTEQELLYNINNDKKLINDCINNINKINNDINDLNNKKTSSLNTLCVIKEKTRQNDVKLAELKPKIVKAEENKEYAEELRDKIDKINIETLEPLQNIYDKCRQNRQIADEYDVRKKRLDDNENLINEKETEKKILIDKLKELKVNFSEENLLKLERETDELNVIRIDQKGKEVGLRKDIEQKNKEIEECKKIEKEINKLSDEIKIVMHKLTLTKIFRDNIRDLGRIVVERRVQNIVYNANDYFNRITNRSETIMWLCTEDEKYSLYLDDGKSRCNFANLSGGEQISVAIAIRLALSQEFGNTSLIILDEPTNNLDQNKRQLLAENLPKMVESLKQLFVVTHDDIFKNYATKVIEFSDVKEEPLDG